MQHIHTEIDIFSRDSVMKSKYYIEAISYQNIVYLFFILITLSYELFNILSCRIQCRVLNRDRKLVPLLLIILGSMNSYCSKIALITDRFLMPKMS